MHKLNLIPPEVSKRKHKKRLKLVYICIFCALFIVIFLSLYHIDNKIVKINHEIEKTRKEHSSFYAKIDTGEKIGLVSKDLENRQTFYKKIMLNRFKGSFFIDNVVSLKPADVLLHNVDLDKDGFLIIEGYAPNSVSVAQMINQLKKVKDFDEIDLNFIRYMQDTLEYERYAFKMTLKLKRLD
jgi:hypothetical protein